MIAPSPSVFVDPLLGPDELAAMTALAQRAGRYRTYSTHERQPHPVGEGLSQRHDSLVHFVRTGGRLGRVDGDRRRLAARTSYFREEYAYGGVPLVEGIAGFLHHPALLEAARHVHDRPVVEPSIAYANVMLPGQELAVHTDVAEFRGLDRKIVPQWLLVVMHHSGLFERWRLPIATGIAWCSDGAGGELSLWPDGPDAPVVVHPARAGTALVLDTDSTFHGVDPVGGPDVEPPPVTGDAELTLDATDGRWVLTDVRSGDERARYGWDELRLSVSWKAYCFADVTACAAWATHTDDLDEDHVLDTLVADLVDRELVQPGVARDGALGQLLIDTHISFPAATTA